MDNIVQRDKARPHSDKVVVRSHLDKRLADNCSDMDIVDNSYCSKKLCAGFTQVFG